MSAQPVFLSYASQDAEVAKTLCDAMRAVGIDVWFDQSELRGGDAWDQKIRRQIRECRLFMPLVSANTNARPEGYFRLEWKLAVDRSHLMADDEPFLFPVAIDGLGEAEARVPDRFREVQWARLGGKDTPESIAERVVKLLGAAPADAERAAARPARPAKAPPSRYVWPVAIVAIVALALWHAGRDVSPVATPASPAIPAVPAPPAAASEATQLARRAIAHTTKFNFKREDLAVAADLARKATELEPTLAVAWGARARAEASWMHRNWDVSPERRQASADFAKRALALDPEEPSALWSQGAVLRQQRASLPDAVALFQRALKAAPDDNYIRRALAGTFRQLGRLDEAIATYDEALRRDPRDALSHYSLSILYAGFRTLKDNDLANVDVALRHLDRAIELQPAFGSAVLEKAAVLAAWKGDLPGARATLERFSKLSLEETTEDRAIYFQMWIAMLEGQPDRALAAAGRSTSPYFSDVVVAQPIAWMKALAHRQAGRASAAAEEWRAAEAVLRGRLEKSPNSLQTQAELAITLAMLGRKEEAARQFARYEATMREQGQGGTLTNVRFQVAMGDPRRAVAAIREARKTPWMWLTYPALARDPWFDPLRAHPDFKALLKELETGK